MVFGYYGKIPPVDFELADVDPRPIDLKKARESYPNI
jgi:hypothetical protein